MRPERGRRCFLLHNRCCLLACFLALRSLASKALSYRVSISPHVLAACMRARTSCSSRYAVRHARVHCPPDVLSCETPTSPLRRSTSPEASCVNIACCACSIRSDCAYDRLLPARLSSLMPIVGILLNRLLLDVDDDFAEAGAEV